jgi:uncharacterized YigZ family protein
MAEINDQYTIITQPGESLHKVKGSKHFGYARYADNLDQVNEILNEIRKAHYASRHVCYAYSLNPENPVQKSTDDGEPHNSAGPPILGQINAAGLTNVVVAVVRYFGGTKLGVGGLVSAYKTAAQEAIADAQTAHRYIQKPISIYFGYNDMSLVMRMAKQEGITILEQNFAAECELKITIRASLYQDFCQKLDKLHTLTYK